jgi:hypothetical protein
MSIQGKEDGGFELVTTALRGMVHNRLNYLIGEDTIILNIKKQVTYKKINK